MEYAEKTSQRSQRYVKLFWSLKKSNDAADAVAEPILPDGCFEIVFDLSDRFIQIFDDGSRRVQPRTIIAGQISSRILVVPTGESDLFGVRFHPFGAYPFLGFSANSFTDTIIDAAHVFGRDEALIFEQLSETTDLCERINIFEDFLFKRLDNRKQDQSGLDHIIGEIIKSDGKLNIGELATEMQWSERRIERKFKECVGISPKLFSRITRFQNMMKKLEQGGNANILDLAFDAGYYDQSHMIREFKQFSGTSPLAFMSGNYQLAELFVGGSSSMSDLYNT